MGYEYSLDITNFKVESSQLFLADLKVVAPDIAEGMREEAGYMIFEPDQLWGKWCNEEDKALPIIEMHILPNTYCNILWEGEDGARGGYLVMRDKNHPIVFNPMVVVSDENGNDLEIPLHEFTNKIKQQGRESHSAQPISQ